MSEVALIEQLDQAIEAMLRNPDEPLAGTDPQVAELVGIALELRALPRADFKARLKSELEREASVTMAVEEDRESPSPADSRPCCSGPRTTERTRSQSW